MNENIATEDVLVERLREAAGQAQLSERPAFALTAQSYPSARFPGLFASPETPLVKLIDSPPSLRRAGFDLETGESRIVRGELRRALVQGWRVLELWRDGVLIYAV